MYLVDGYNLLYARADMIAPEALIMALRCFSDHYQKRLIIVFDGAWEYDGSFDTGFLQVRFVHNADSVLRELSDRYKTACLVSSDSEVYGYARARGRKFLKSNDFDFSIPIIDEKPSDCRISDSEVEAYLRWFSGKE